MTERIPRKVVHYGLFDASKSKGGVETHGRNLALAFQEVLFMSRDSRDQELVRRERLPVICDNQMVLDWPNDVPVIGMQHGVALYKSVWVPSLTNAKMALDQARAAKRPNTFWVAAAEWVRAAFTRLHGARARHVVFHGIDLERFDGRLENAGSRVLLHDARSTHKGSRLYPQLAKAFPEWRFELLGAGGEPVPDHMRRARAFLHLSRYEGNSLVCCEAMAMNLPCLFTRVGLMLDGPEQFDVSVVRRRDVFGSRRRLLGSVGEFLAGLETRRYAPRPWVQEHASFEANRAAWQAVVDDFDATARW
jgi:glycosyltransferase involved in cell wall biosynthesis